MEDLLKRISEKKQRLDKYKPLPEVILKNLDEWYTVELTYTSNAIEGNTLSRVETALIIEKGITVEGKTITEHLEAINHAKALDFVKTLLSKSRKETAESDILDIHRIILQKIDDQYAGRYRDVPVRIRGSNHICPNPLKVPELMQQFYQWLHTDNPEHIAQIAAEAHFKFVSIHPFVDGNGRLSRILMNLLLMQEGYPPAIIRKEDRRVYIDALENAHMGGLLTEFYRVIYEAVDRSLDIYLETMEPKEIAEQNNGEKIKDLLKIGDLAQLTGENTVTIRFWTTEGLLDVKENTPGGYRLFDPKMIDRVKFIQRLKNEERLTLNEIKDRLERMGRSQTV